MARHVSEPLIEFVPGKNTTSRLEENLQRLQTKSKPELNGDDVKSFYEDLVGGNGDETRSSRHDSGSQKNRSNSRKRRNQNDQELFMKVSDCSSVTSGRDVARFMRNCQDGNVKDVGKDLKKGIDINSRDQYGWTPLMCAAHAGSDDVVKLLLNSGADLMASDKHGKTARDLAQQNRRISTITLIDQITSGSHQSVKKDKRTCESQESFCDVCNLSFSEETFKSHLSSTVHLFNRKLKPSQPSYLINETNVGYQMMLRSGWNMEKGLGPEGTGRKYPVKTLLKRNREGLGMENTKTPKVTHFKPKDTSAVKSVHRSDRIQSARTMSRKARRRKEQKDRDWERRLREHMNS